MKNLFFKRKKTFFLEPFVYLNEDGSLCKDGISSTVLWLKKIEVKAYSEKDADKIAFQITGENYPQYKGYLFLF